jgi:hypothetical protein
MDYVLYSRVYWKCGGSVGMGRGRSSKAHNGFTYKKLNIKREGKHQK